MQQAVARSQAQGSSDDDDDDSDSDMDSEDADDMQHFADVCYSLVGYEDDANQKLEQIEASLDSVEDPADRELFMTDTKKMMKDLRDRTMHNARFLKSLIETDEDAQQFAKIPETHQVQERNAVKARTVLRQFVRDWAEEGKQERDSEYGCLLSALEKYLPLEASRRTCGCGSTAPKVLTPGSGLARLPFEVASRGYSCQGNEFSYHMLQGSKWVLNETFQANSHTIFPFVLNLEHRKGSKDHLRGVKIPDVCPSSILCPDGVQKAELSMCAGEFVEVYGQEAQKGDWDACLSCFFIDTAKNIFLYIRTIANILRPGGVFANIGPLLYHYAEQSNAISIELSWEEIKPEIEKYFDFKEEDERPAYYTTNPHNLFRTRYTCKYFVCIRNTRPAEGSSKPVF